MINNRSVKSFYSPERAELDRAAEFERKITEGSAFSFRLDGAPCDGWFSTAARSVMSQETGDIIFTEAAWTYGGLTLEAKISRSRLYPEIEWVLWFSYDGEGSSPEISDFFAVDCVIAPEMTSVHPGINHDVALTHFKGDYFSPDGFEQYERILSNGIPVAFRNIGGRPTSTEFPYYNLGGKDSRVIAAVSWQGQWESGFTFDWKNGVSLKARQQHFRASLAPGERIRSPLVALMFFTSPDYSRSMNLWRRWMLECNAPDDPNGGALKPIVSFGANGRFYEAKFATEENQLFFINKIIENGLPIDYWWIDAMWYELGFEPYPNWCPVGSWNVDKKRFPRGFAPLAERLGEAGAGVMAWFEPERVTPGTYLYEVRPDMLIRLPEALAEPVLLGGMEADENASIDNSLLLDMSRDDVTDWLICRVGDEIEFNKIKLYREDMNTNPLRFWRYKDMATDGRTGITENKYCVNRLRYLNALRARFPGMLVDSCASGGRRMELETMRIAVGVHKTDYGYSDPIAKPAFHQTLFQWLPYFGSSGLSEGRPMNLYTFLMNLAGWVGLDFDFRDENFDYVPLQKFFALREKIVHCIFGDFLPLSPFTRDRRGCVIWQFDCPERGDGIIAVMKHTDCPFTSVKPKLLHLDPDASYAVSVATAFELGEPRGVTGADLSAGLELPLPDGEYAVLVYYNLSM